METTLLSLRPQNILTIAVIIVALGFVFFAIGQGYSYLTGNDNGQLGYS
jgi:hypothetical protein